jgi:hypothetical protein
MNIVFMILKIMTTLVLTVFAIASALYAPKQKTASDGVFFFATAMFLAFGITFMWV